MQYLTFLLNMSALETKATKFEPWKLLGMLNKSGSYCAFIEVKFNFLSRSLQPNLQINQLWLVALSLLIWFELLGSNFFELLGSNFFSFSPEACKWFV